MMECSIKTWRETQVIGLALEMSFARNLTPQLWKSFMQRRHEVKNKINSDFISLQVYPSTFSFQSFDPTTTFTKWACVAVKDVGEIPAGFKSMTIDSGLYAVFQYKGSPADAPKAFQYIFGEWLPSSSYTVDDRPHFEVLGATYKQNHSDSEEEIWIPIKTVS